MYSYSRDGGLQVDRWYSLGGAVVHSCIVFAFYRHWITDNKRIPARNYMSNDINHPNYVSNTYEHMNIRNVMYLFIHYYGVHYDIFSLLSKEKE